MDIEDYNASTCVLFEYGGLSEEISEKGRGGRKWERKGQQRGTMGNITKVAAQRSDK